MKCPSCAAAYAEGAKECSQCGVNFVKWEEKRLRSPVSSAPAAAPSQASDGVGLFWPSLLLIPLGLGFMYYRHVGGSHEAFIRAKAEKEAQRRAAEAASASAAPTPLPVNPAAKEALEKLAAVAQELNGEWAANSVSFEAGELKGYYDEGFRDLEAYDYNFQYHIDAAAAGVTPAATQPATAADGQNQSKCDKDGQFVYNMGRGDAGFSNCWKRGNIYQKRQSDGIVVTYLSGAPIAETWTAYQWLPHFQIWSPYNESDFIRAFAYHAEQSYGQAAQAKLRQEIQNGIQRINSGERQGDKAALLRDAISPIYRMRAMYEGMLDRVAYEHKRTGA